MQVNLAIGYVIIANMYGVDFEDASMYMLKNYVNAAYSGFEESNNNDTYIIVPDDATYTGNKNAIKESEFGNHIAEYIDAVYKEKMSYKDTERYKFI